MNAIIDEINDALFSDNNPIENATSLLAVELWKRSRNPIWIKVWIELNYSSYTSVASFASDMSEVFEF